MTRSTTVMESGFARRQLEKFGWRYGQGLGKEENGIAKPVKVGIKRDNGGVGHTPGNEFASQWWSGVFNEAASSISVCNAEEEVVIKASGSEAVQSLTRRHYGRHRRSLLYGGFVHSSGSALSGNHGDATKECPNRKRENPSVSGKGEERWMADEDLWRACGGRTAHKAARHGLRLNGKLKRLYEQEASGSLSDLPTKGHKPRDKATFKDGVIEKKQECSGYHGDIAARRTRSSPGVEQEDGVVSDRDCRHGKRKKLKLTDM